MRRPLLAMSLLLTTRAGTVTAQDSPPPAGTGNTCVECHQTLEGRLGEVVGEWHRSSHAAHGISCDGCHRGDPTSTEFAKSPATGFLGKPRLREVPYMCGRCHEPIQEKHLASPHGALGLPHCVSCHGSHEVRAPVPERIITEEACTRCHSFDQAASSLHALEKARRLFEEFEGVAAGIQHISAAAERLDSEREALNLTREGIVSTFHSFRIGEIEGIGTSVDRLKRFIAEMQTREEDRRTHFAQEVPFILALMVFLVLASAFGYAVFHEKVSLDEAEPE